MPIVSRKAEPTRGRASAERINTPLATTSPRAVSLAGMQPELIPGYGNVTHEDLVVPRIKLVQGMCAER